MNNNEKVIRSFWEFFHKADFDSAAELLSDNCIVIWPNTKEIFQGKANFIQANKDYPGRWYVDVEEIMELKDLVISVVRVFSQEINQSFYATSFFKMHQEKIIEIKEYWGENGPPPKWRLEKGYSSLY
jgi:hypothetical protein